MKIRYFFILFFLMFSFTSFTQVSSIESANKKQRKLFEKAKNDFKDQKYGKAQKKLEELLDKQPDIIEAHALIAKVLLESKKGDAAISHLDFLCQNAPEFDPSSCYTLFKIYNIRSDYDHALKYISKFDQQLNDGHKLKDKIKRQKALVSFRDSLIKNPKPFKPIRLDSLINTENLEYLPAMTADGQTLIFTRRVARQEDFYEARFKSDTLVSVNPISDLNTNYDEGAHCISSDGNLLIFTACYRPDSKGSCDLYYCIQTEDGWSEPKNMGKQINSDSWDAQPSLSPDGQTLYFASNRDGGYGNKDIWKSTLKDRRWTKPVNLGQDVNTKGNEASPFIHFDNSSLYFRSDSHPGLGGFDIFYTRLEGSNWSEVLNLGYPINTRYDEGALTVDLKGQYAYFASDQLTKRKKAHLDIFKFELPEEFRPKPVSYVKLYSEDAQTNEALQSKLFLINVESGDTVIIKQTDHNGSALIIAEANTKYALHLDSKGYLFHSEHVYFDPSDIREPIEKKIMLSPIPKTFVSQDSVAPIVLQNIFFAQGSAELLSESDVEIKKLAQLLLENEDKSIIIIGHTDNIGSESDNIKLSLDRANSVKNAIIALGIDSQRIEAIGKGESEPIADNNLESGREKNRRTEFRLK